MTPFAHVAVRRQGQGSSLSQYTLTFAYGGATTHARKFWAHAAEAGGRASALLAAEGLEVVEWVANAAGGLTADQLVRGDR